MKTSGVPHQTPPASTKATADKTTSKTDSKPQKEFKEVLDSDTSKAPPPKAKFGKIAPKGQRLGKREGVNQPLGKEGNPSLTTAGRKPISSKSGKEDLQEGSLKKEELSRKSGKESEDLKEFSVPTHMMMGPSIQSKTEVQKTHGQSLNIKEIESIVQKVQVGMNEKGLPEMNFELMTDKLGALNLKVSSENEKISIQFVTQDSAAQAELQKGLTDLSQLLGQRGLNLAETNVMTRDQQSQQQQEKERSQSDSSIQGQVGKTRSRKKNISGPSDDGFTI